MLNVFAKWYVSRSLDCDRPLPKWVERRMSRDQSLREFHRRSTMLIQRLRAANGSVAESDFTGAFKSPAATFGGRRALGALAIAALILIAVWPLFGFQNRRHVAAPPEVTADHRVDLASEALELQALVRSGNELLSNWSDRAAQLTEPIADPLQDTGSWLTVFESDSDKFAEQLASQVIAPTSELGSRYGKFLSDVDGQIASNNRLMISDSISAWRSLLRGAPERIAAFSWTMP